MARQSITVAESTRAGVEPTEYTGVALDGLQFDNTGQNVLLLVTAPVGGGDVTVITDQQVDSDLDVADRTTSFTASQFKVLGPYSNVTYGGTDGIIHIDISADDFLFRAVRVGNV